MKQRRHSTINLVETCNTVRDTIFHVGIIGDSWVHSGHIETGLQEELIYLDNLNTSSFAHSGGTSKNIYEDLFLPLDAKFSSRQIIEGSFDLVIIVAGVNDLIHHVGKEFYSEHVLKIVKQLNICGIYPVVLSLPEFGIDEFYETRYVYEKILIDTPRRIWFEDFDLNPRNKYIEELKEKLKKSNLEYMMIEYDDFISDFSNSMKMYAGWFHLCGGGEMELGHFIGKKIKTKVKNNSSKTAASIAYK